jgi:hypothetical protein
MLARTGADPGEAYDRLTAELGPAHYARTDVAVTPAQRDRLRAVAADDLGACDLAGEAITAVLTTAPGNGAPFGGIKVCAAGGWFAVRPSGTESSCKIYAESFRDPAHMRAVQAAAQATLDELFATRDRAPSPRRDGPIGGGPRCDGTAPHAAQEEPIMSIDSADRGLREAVGLFDDPTALQEAIDELLSSGFDRAELSLLAPEAVVERKLGYAVRRSRLEDDPETPRSVYVSPDAVGAAEGGLIGALSYVGGVAAAGAIALAGGPLSLIVLGAGGAGLAGGLIGAELARLLDARQAATIHDHLQQGGLLLWVRTWDDADEARAVAILRAHSGRDVHLHSLREAAPTHPAPG